MTNKINDLVVDHVDDVDRESTAGTKYSSVLVLKKKGMRISLRKEDGTGWAYNAGEKVSIEIKESNTKVSDHVKGAKK